MDQNAANQLSGVLTNAQNPDLNIRQMAEKWLTDLEQQNWAMFMQLLSFEMANNDKSPVNRQLAGLLLKRALNAKEEPRLSEVQAKWTSLDPNARNQMKQMALQTLASNDEGVRKSTAQVISKYAFIDLPRQQWNELIPALVANMQVDNVNLKQSTLEALGYVCEETDPAVLEAQSNAILTAVCSGIKDDNHAVKHAGLTALYNALEFVRSNFEKEVERNYIMQVVCDSTVAPQSKVKIAALECLVKIASLYYDKLPPYMQRIFQITLEAIKKEEDAVAQQGVEFWSTICDEEIFLIEEAEEEEQPPEQASQNFIKGALQYLVPVLTEALTKQSDDPDDEEWTVAKAAGTCLSLVAQVPAGAGEESVQYVVPFVREHINSPNWKFREAATLAFGSVLEVSTQFLSTIIAQALPVLVTHLQSDTNVHVKDTTAWTIGRVCQLHPENVAPVLAQLVPVLLEALKESPKVAATVCWAIHNLAQAYDQNSDQPTSALSPFFQAFLQSLVVATQREDVDESNLRASGYEAINTLIQYSAKDTEQFIGLALPVFFDRLEKTFQMQIVDMNDKDEQVEMQSLLCSVIQITIQKLGDKIKPVADRAMTLFLQVFQQKSASVHEEALMAVGALADAVGTDFEKYMQFFRPFLLMGLRNYEEHQVCALAVGVVGDLARALQVKLLPYCDEIVQLLLQDLQNPLLHRSVKPPILACFGDIALAISGEFRKYLPVVMSMLQQASTTTVNPNDYDMVDYLNDLREGIFEAYTGIIQALATDKTADPDFLPFVGHLIQFAQFVISDPNKSEAVCKGTVGVLGDLAAAIGSKVKQAVQTPVITNFIKDMCKSDSQNVKDTAKWTKDTITKLA
eukprot:TRINITY_DN30919_c0_g1_i1.p1 TRINITY_DN30919_c0_g1~~TRINITY_DN30919_c0_g1_i1.p1  ORF type:complete len:857 (-),score=244.06 TRINITY_DN30919_c0_g1_i1:643-3213(-)